MTSIALRPASIAGPGTAAGPPEGDDPGAGACGAAAARRFASFDHLVRAWYVAAPSRRVRRGRATTIDLAGKPIAIWRDEAGSLHAIDASCPHLGADLGQGEVIDGCLRCPFHHWTWSGHGTCVGAPGCPTLPARRAVTHRTTEAHGLAWIWPRAEGGAVEPPAALDLPGGDDPRGYLVLRLPSQRIRCHPHLVIGNGLDVAHFGPLHGMPGEGTDEFEESSGGTLSVRLSGAPRSTFWRLVLGGRGGTVTGRFTTHGPSIAWTTVTTPWRFHVLFTARPTGDRHAFTSSVWFLPRTIGLAPLRCLLFTVGLLRDDRRILERLEFRRAFGPADRPLRRFAELVDACEVAW